MTQIDIFDDFSIINGCGDCYGIIFYTEGPTGCNRNLDQTWNIKIVTSGWASRFLFFDQSPFRYAVIQLEDVSPTVFIQRVGQLVRLTYNFCIRRWVHVALILQHQETPVEDIAIMARSWDVLFFGILNWLWSEDLTNGPEPDTEYYSESENESDFFME